VRERERERGPKELAARNNGKSSVYLMASNHAILSSTAGLLPRCIRGAGVGSALTPGPNSPPAGHPRPTREGGTNSRHSLPRARGASCFRYNSKTRRGVARARGAKAAIARPGIPRHCSSTTLDRRDTGRRAELIRDVAKLRLRLRSSRDPSENSPVCDDATDVNACTTAFFFSFFFFLSSAMREFRVDRASDRASKEVGSNVIRAGRCFLETQRRFYRRLHESRTGRSA